jgi:hypothetical protein
MSDSTTQLGGLEVHATGGKGATRIWTCEVNCSCFRRADLRKQKFPQSPDRPFTLERLDQQIQGQHDDIYYSDVQQRLRY